MVRVGVKLGVMVMVMVVVVVVKTKPIPVPEQMQFSPILRTKRNLVGYVGAIILPH